MKPINEQINPNFIIQAKKLAKYTRLLREILPADCFEHVQVANIRDQNLILITDSPVWTTRLRQLSPQILQHVHKSAQKHNASGNQTAIIHHVQIRTRYQTSNEEKQQSLSKRHHPLPPISDNTAELLSQSASSINDPQLKTALLKLAGNLARRNTKHTEK